jgi:hypothetical protein
MLVALATLLFAAAAAAVTFPDRGSFAFGVFADSGESAVVRHHGGAVRIEYEDRADVVLLLLPADGVMVYAETGYGVQIIPFDELMVDDYLFDSIAEAFHLLLAPDAPMHPCVRMSVHDRLPPGDIPLWDCRIVANDVVEGRATTRWSVQEVWGPDDADPPHTVWVDDELGVPIQYRDGIDGMLLAFGDLVPGGQDPALFTVPVESP